jgi:ATP-dependent helicase HepA
MQSVNNRTNYVAGQRWVSIAEPELGMGRVAEVEMRRITLDFESSGERRIYASANAPLTRVRYAVGDRVSDGMRVFEVTEVREEGGLITYCGDGIELCEGALCSQSVFNRPQDMLLGGAAGSSELFALRGRVYEALHAYRRSPLRGLQGGRISLIPHQLYVVESAVRMAAPRVMLADEIGLGKTIEACLILHRKLMLGQITRALVVVPAALIHQWFVELLRRFSLKAAIFDEERCAAIEAGADSENPFLEDQLVLCAIDWLTDAPLRALQAVQAGWDLLIVDEAHHLEWSEQHSSPSYAVVEALAECCPGVLLLTATPEETGRAGHFARLRLLDPQRYSSLAAYDEETEQFSELVPIAEALENGQELEAPMRQTLCGLGLDPEWDARRLLAEMIDCYGPGRVIFRNTRRIIKGFPPRFAHPVCLDAVEGALDTWFAARLQELAPAKVLAITHHAAEAQRLYDMLREKTGLAVGLFHEGMTLLQRDRQAAWFADPEGARVLVASEIGGEGRNFQFAHHLVMLDVPANPEVIEQRIGRLDRIGQQHAIHVHVPYVRGSMNEKYARWLHEGLDAFGHPLPGAHEIYRICRRRLEDPELQVDTQAWEDFIAYSRAECHRIAGRVIHGRDRLLQLHSYRAESARGLVEALEKLDADTSLEAFLLALFDAYGVYPEIIENRCWLLRPDPVFSDCFPAFPREGMMVTFDRAFAMVREDVGFLTWDHPLVTGAIERVLGGVDGTAAQVVWQAPEAPDGRFVVELRYILEPAASACSAERFLPLSPLRVLLDDTGKIFSRGLPPEETLRDAQLLDDEVRDIMQQFLQRHLEYAEEVVGEEAEALKRAALERVRQETAREEHRVDLLRRRAGDVGGDLHHTGDDFAAIESVVRDAPVRLDAIRWIWCRRTGRG